MNEAQRLEHQQAAHWNGVAGRNWVEAQAVIDRMFQPFEDLLVDAVRSAGAANVLDIGCGAGATTLAVTKLLGETGGCEGIDISEPLIVAAQARAVQENSAASFICADAQDYEFEPAKYDMMVSRFGVMFFENFTAAFVNLRQAMRADGVIALLAWRDPRENQFMTTAERAAAPLLKELPPRDPEAPGQFAFADRGKVRRILEQSGWSDIAIRPVDQICTFPESELTRFLTLLGPVGRVVQELEEQERMQVIELVRRAFDPFVDGTEVRFTAACWLIAARAPYDTTLNREPGQ